MSVIAGTTLVICTRERHRLLTATVDSILAGGRLPEELLVVDQSERRHLRFLSEPRLSGCQIRYRHSPPLGVSAARNVGIENARGDIVAFTDDDMLAPPNWFGCLVKPLTDANQTVVVTGPLLPTEPLAPGAFQLAVRTSSRAATFSKPGNRDVLVAANMAARKDTLLAVGPFDVRLGPGTPYAGGEDNEYCLRLLRAGCRILYRPEAAIYHRAWRPGSDYLRMRWRYGVGQGGFYGKLLGQRDRYGVERLIRQLGYYAARFPWRIVTQSRRAVGDVVFVCGLLYGTSRWLFERAGDDR